MSCEEAPVRSLVSREDSFYFKMYCTVVEMVEL